MKPIDYRNATFRDIQARLDKNRQEVWLALLKHGPCTTRELAGHLRWDILNVRPRVTELVQLCFAQLEVINGNATRKEGEGVYQGLSEAQAMALYSERVREARREIQPDLFKRAKGPKVSRQTPRVVYRKLGRHRVWGFYCQSANLIELDDSLRHLPYKELETLIHEGLHHVFPAMSEEEVERACDELGVILWNQNYRRVSQ